jgi:multiple sugar transport system ATP-binding protein
MARVALIDVTKEYSRTVRAVDQVSLEAPDGEFLVIVGPSGCGKTTTLRLIAGLEEVTSGTIQIGETDVTHLAPKDRDISMVFQNYALWPHMSVRQNLSFGLRLRNRISPLRMLSARLLSRARYRELSQKAAEIEQRVVETSRMLGIEQLLERKPRSLSGGEQQRVAVGRALVRRPKVFLFDEPLSNLDAVLRVELRRELRRLHRLLGATMVYVTHDQTEAMTLGTRIAVMDGGRVRQVAEPLAIYDRPADRFVAGFVGSPPMNFFDGTLVRHDGRLSFRTGELVIPLGAQWQSHPMTTADRAVCLGIRPEHLALEPPERASESAAISGQVTLTEPLGNETVVHLAIGPGTLTLRADAHHCPPIGATLAAYLHLPRIHLFDAATGKAL